MAKTISIKCNGVTCDVAPVKVERRKIYGYSQVRAVTPEGGVCTNGGINNDGTTLVDLGCTKTGLIKSDGEWMERSELQAYNADGTAAEFHVSTFESGIELNRVATVEELLDLNVAAVYQLGGNDALKLREMIGDEIYRCSFSYRGGYELNEAFVLKADDSVFIITGQSSVYEPIGISQEGNFDDENDETSEEEDELDFSMM